mgnify:CR=1 FL=1
MKNQGFWRRLGYAANGIRTGLRSERSLRTQAVMAVGALLLLIGVRPAPVWWALVGIMIALVLAAELINTALEALVDRLHPGRHPQIRVVKDCAAGAVLVLSVAALWVAGWMLWATLGGE